MIYDFIIHIIISIIEFLDYRNISTEKLSASGQTTVGLLLLIFTLLSLMKSIL